MATTPSVTTGQFGYQFHRHHRRPGTHPPGAISAGLRDGVKGRLDDERSELALEAVARPRHPAASLALFAIDAAITIFTGRPVWRSGGRQLVLGLVAATLTFSLGKVLGVALS